MATRRELLLDAAIELVGTRGVKGTTHRAVDTAAGLPAGSASNLFRTREALLNGVVERFAARERSNLEEVGLRMMPRTPAELAHTLTEFARQSTGEHRTLTMARYAILVEAGIQPELRRQLADTGARVDAWATAWFRTAGSPDPDRHAPVIMNHWTGVVLHQLAMPDPEFDPYPQFEALVTALIRNESAEVPQ